LLTSGYFSTAAATATAPPPRGIPHHSPPKILPTRFTARTPSRTPLLALSQITPCDRPVQGSAA
jgi:hypothetical protein